eukprot:gene6629-6268_t
MAASSTLRLFGARFLSGHRPPPPLTHAEDEELAYLFTFRWGGGRLRNGRDVDQELLHQLFASWDPTECGAIPKQAYREWWLRHVGPDLGLTMQQAVGVLNQRLRPLKAVNKESLSWGEFNVLMYSLARM